MRTPAAAGGDQAAQGNASAETPQQVPPGAADAVARRSPFYALRFRNFRLFFYGQMISVAGSWMQSVAEQWLIWDLTHSEAWLGIVSGASALPYVLFTVWGGQLADRFPRRSILVITQTIALVLALVLAVLAALHRVQPWHIAALAACLGVVNAFNVPAQQAFVTDMIEGSDALPNAIALNSLQFNLARIVGPIIAGGVLVVVGPAGCFGVNSLSFVAVIISLLMMRLAPHKKREIGDKASSLWEGFAYIWRTPTVLRIILLVSASSMMMWSVGTLYPVFATSFHEGARGFSQMMTANGVGAATGGFLMATYGERLSRRHLIYGGATVFAISLLLFTFAAIYWVALLTLVLGGLSMMTLGVNSNTRVQQQVPNHLRGRVMAVYSLVFGGLMPLGGLEIGFLANHLSAHIAVRMNATFALIVTITIFTWSEISHRRLKAAAGADPRLK